MNKLIYSVIAGIISFAFVLNSIAQTPISRAVTVGGVDNALLQPTAVQLAEANDFVRYIVSSNDIFNMDRTGSVYYVTVNPNYTSLLSFSSFTSSYAVADSTTNYQSRTGFIAASNALDSRLYLLESSIVTPGTVESLQTNVAARLASNVWALADSTTNYVKRTGDAMSGNLNMLSGVITNVTSLYADSIKDLDVLDFNLAQTNLLVEGRMYWNDAKKTLTLGLPGEVNGDVLQTVLAMVRNSETFTLTRGTVVYLAGSSGDLASVRVASYSNDTLSARTMGIVSHDILPGDTGLIVTKGVISKMSTGSFTPGAALWLGAYGNFQTNRPVAPLHGVFLGIVERSNNGNGLIYVQIQNGYELEELHNVLITSVTDNQAIVYDSTQGYWTNKGPVIFSDGSVAYAASMFEMSGQSPTIKATANKQGITLLGGDNSSPGTGSAGNITLTPGVGIAAGTSAGKIVMDGNIEFKSDLTGPFSQDWNVRSSYEYNAPYNYGKDLYIGGGQGSGTGRDGQLVFATDVNANEKAITNATALQAASISINGGYSFSNKATRSAIAEVDHDIIIQPGLFGAFGKIILKGRDVSAFSAQTYEDKVTVDADKVTFADPIWARGVLSSDGDWTYNGLTAGSLLTDLDVASDSQPIRFRTNTGDGTETKQSKLYVDDELNLRYLQSGNTLAAKVWHTGNTTTDSGLTATYLAGNKAAQFWRIGPVHLMGAFGNFFQNGSYQAGIGVGNLNHEAYGFFQQHEYNALVNTRKFWGTDVDYRILVVVRTYGTFNDGLHFRLVRESNNGSQTVIINDVRFHSAFQSGEFWYPELGTTPLNTADSVEDDWYHFIPYWGSYAGDNGGTVHFVTVYMVAEDDSPIIDPNE